MLQANFIMIYIIHKFSVWLKITGILKCFLRSIIDSFFFLNNSFFSQHIMMKSSRLKEDKNTEENIINDVRNILRLKKLKKETNDAAIKGIRNLFRLKIRK